MATTFDEMAECRATIGREDQLLEDLRKYGFSLITALLTASGVAAGITHTTSVLPVAAATIMFLVVVLFGIDMYYYVILSAAVERSMDLEIASEHPTVRITSTISGNAIATHAVTAVFVLYAVFLGLATAVGYIGGDTTAHIALPILGVSLFTPMTLYWFYIRHVTKLHETRLRVHPAVLSAGTTTTVDIIGSGFLTDPQQPTKAYMTDLPTAVVHEPTHLTSSSMRVQISLPEAAAIQGKCTILLTPVRRASHDTIEMTIEKRKAAAHAAT
jgi:hypothetical protein